ncbi:MAG: AMP-binding protein [Desulfobacterales bacterium]|nr:AMP-binding protein [Desulfobacterales bacterium]
MGLYDFTFYDMINRNAESFRTRPAWFEVDDGRALNFSEIKERVDSLSVGLQKAGVKKGDRLGVLGKNSLEYFLLYGAAAALGAIVLPINWRLSAEEVAFNLNDCEPGFLFVDQEFQELVDGVKDSLPTVNAYYNLKSDAGVFTAFESLMEEAAQFQAPDVSTDDGFVIIHTAAVAGRPRGALLSHGNVLCANMHMINGFGLSCEDVHLNLLPLFHVGGLFMATCSFHAGALNINVSKFDAEKAVDLIRERKISLMFDFSPILSSVLEEHEKTGKDISTLQSVMGLDGPETIEKYQQLTGGTFHVMYGQTETSCLATMSPYNERPGSAGRVIPLADVRLVDDNDNTVAPGEVGEIAMKGPMIFKGYWSLPNDNQEAFRGGWHHTGDQGRFDEDGYLFYAGRKPEKELIKPGGENVYPAEVEKVILEHPAVEKTVVFGVPDPKWKEGIKAVCLLKEGETLAPKDLISFVGDRIARYKKPQYVEYTTDFPLQKDGSPDRAAVKERFGGEQ